MTEFEQNILERLDFLEGEVRLLKQTTAQAAQAFEDLPDETVVGKDYVAYRFGITERAVVRGERGTAAIRRVSKKPLKFIKREVDKLWREKTKPPKTKAAELREKAKTRRYSIIGK